LKDVFKEALRLYPPVGFLSRDCVKDTVMRDKHMTTKDVVMISPWLIHRHHDYWHKPNDFDPHRFAADRNGQGGKSLPPAACYLPFGSGQRVCIGAAFAQQEALLILAAILKDHQLALAEGFTPKPVGRLTIRSKNGMRVRLTPRQSLPRDGTTEQRCSGVSTSSGHVPEETEL